MSSTPRQASGSTCASFSRSSAAIASSRSGARRIRASPSSDSPARSWARPSGSEAHRRDDLADDILEVPMRLAGIPVDSKDDEQRAEVDARQRTRRINDLMFDARAKILAGFVDLP